MTSYFPDANTWLALVWEGYATTERPQRGSRAFRDRRVSSSAGIRSLGVAAVVTNAQAMGASVVNLQDAFALYDRFLEDPRIQLNTERDGLDRLARRVEPRSLARSRQKPSEISI